MTQSNGLIHSPEEATPDRGGVLLVAARRAVEAGRTVAGRALLEAVRGLGCSPDALDELDTQLLLGEDKVEAAIAVAGRAIARNPADWRHRCARAEARLAARDAVGAACDAADAVVAAPAEPQPKAVLGSAMLILGHIADARACLAEAVAAQPAHVGYRLTLARALVAMGDIAAARATLDEAIALRPLVATLRMAAIRLAVTQEEFEAAVQLADAARDAGVIDACILGLRGHALSCLDRDDDAVEAYREALQLGPEDPYVRHLVAAAGLVAAPARASPEYVRVLFDGFASHFENDLIRLDYRIPGLVRAALLAHLPQLAADPAQPGASPWGPVLDLGCGTGLIAVVLSDLAVGPFTGIDLSPGMLAEAAAKGLYDRLIEGDVCEDTGLFAPYRLAVAADVLPYLGDPGPMLRAVGPAMTEGGVLILTFEALPDIEPSPFRLGIKARYAHRPDALAGAALAAGFVERDRRRSTLRADRGRPVDGYVMVFARFAPASPDAYAAAATP